MAQGLVLAQNLLTGGREKAFSGVMVLTDGSPSFVYETKQVVSGMEEKGIMRYMMPITDASKNIALMEKFASEPSEGNMVKFTTFDDLTGDALDVNVAKCIKTFCPSAANCYVIYPNYPILVQAVKNAWRPRKTRYCRWGYKAIGGGWDTLAAFPRGCSKTRTYGWWFWKSTLDTQPDKSSHPRWTDDAWRVGKRIRYFKSYTSVMCVPDNIYVNDPVKKTDCGASGECTALCAHPGKIAGGGCQAPNGAVKGSHPNEDGDGWTCVGDSIAEATAICIPQENYQPRIEIVTKSITGSKWPKVQASCKGNEQLFGGGCLSSAGSCMSMPGYWNKNTWDCHPMVESEGEYKAFAICGPRARVR